MTERALRIGTRDSALAMWQARYVAGKLAAAGIPSVLIPVKSDGERDQTTPLYELGVEGIFTRALDAALLAGEIDLAVHSLKDVPTRLAEGLALVAVPPRGNWRDLLAQKDGDPARCERREYTLATSSLRRRAQWLHRHPTHRVVPLRGNLQTRRDKLLRHDDWDGVIFAAAGVERIGLELPKIVSLDWMLPAPAQGALGLVARDGEAVMRKATAALHDEATAACVHAERGVLRALMGGCSMPIAALAQWETPRQLRLRASVLSLDGRERAAADMRFHEKEIADAARRVADAVLADGGQEILEKIRGL